MECTWGGQDSQVLVIQRYNRQQPMDIHSSYQILPTKLAQHVEQNQLQGKLRFNLFVGASTGAETEDKWASLNMIDRRAPHQVGI